MILELRPDTPDSGDPCPKCKGTHTVSVRTTNEWVFYCRDCDLRFNNVGETHQSGSPLPRCP